MDFKETVHQASIASLQRWLASELELHKIDAVIYTRHVLDIFLNSRHTNDLHLAEKEANIFAKLPGSKNRKPKQKYNKRTNSFNIADEILLKKEMAAKCLLSAVDKNNDDVVNDAAIKKLIENLCSKLNELNMLNESKSSSSSDEEHTTKKQRSLSLPNKQREKYQDAFPLLFAASNGENIQANVNSVWGTKPLFQNAQDTEKSKETSEKPKETSKPNQSATRSRTSRHYHRHKLSQDGSARASKRAHNTSKISTSKFSQKQGWQARQQMNKISNMSQSRTTMHQKYDKRGKNPQSSKRNVNKMQKEWVLETGSSSGYAGVKDGVKKQPICKKISAPAALESAQFEPPQLGFQMFDFNTPECWKFTRQESSEKSVEEAPKLQSKWFRDPESGFLEFDPGKKSPSTKSPKTSLQLDEIVSDEDHGSTSESWLWCPSPSLWEDDESSSPGVVASRLETMYRPNHADSPEAGQLWEDYKAIFTDVEQDLQKCLEESDDSEELDDHLPQQVESILNSIWTEESNFPLEVNAGVQASDENGNYLKPDAKFCEKESCVDTSCLSCSVLKTSLEGEGVDFHALDSSISRDLALLHQQIDAISENLHSFSEKADVGMDLSRKQIWLRNSQGCDYGWPAEFLRGMQQNQVFSDYGKWSEWDDFADGEFGNHGDKTHLMHDFFADMTSTVIGSANLQWLNWSYINPMMDIDRLLHFQTTSDDELGQHQSKEDDEDPSFISALVQSVLEYATDAEDQNPLMLRVDVAEHTMLDVDCPLPHPEDQLQLFPPDSRNLQEKSQDLADCVTENEAWKTSLRIGNMWQAIAGIRPVDIVYSEKHNPTGPCVLQPSAMTHFRPIHQSDENENNATENSATFETNTSYHDVFSGSYMADISPKKQQSSNLHSEAVEFQLKSIEKEIGKLLFENPSCNDGIQKICPKKPGLDKSQQTGMFEHQIQLMDNDLENELAGRPPKANSR